MNHPNTNDSSNELAALRAALQGQYTIERELGRGGMGIVLLARDERLDRHVALKVLPPALADQQETRERFLREARLAARLSHPNIVPVYRADEIGGFAFFAMGYIDGETLAERVRDRGVLPLNETVRVLREVAWALAYSHARGIVHRDVKPENILIERGTGRSLVTDFGIARSEFNPALTVDGHVLGTVHYMSPEQATGEPLDGRSDLYALGCVAFMVLSGRLPFDADSPQAILVAHATKRPPSLRSVAQHVPAPLASVIDRCLNKDPSARFATGEEFAEALGKAYDESSAIPDERQGANTVVSSDDAMHVWRRAAELQAEAAARLEARMRNTSNTKSLALVNPNSQPDTTQQPQSDTENAYRLRDVEAAALEAGISQKYVALALAELKSPSQKTLERTQNIPAWKERLATRLLGTSQRQLSVSRVFNQSQRDVLQAIGRTLQGNPYNLELFDTLGGHPLDGGVLVFSIPQAGTENYRFTWTRYGIWVKELRVSLSAIPGDSRKCEVTIQVDLREGITANLIGYGSVSAAVAAGAGTFAAAASSQLLAVGGIVLGAPFLGGAAIAGLAAMLASGPMYRWEIKSASSELEKLLAAIDAGLRSIDLFGESSSARLPSGTRTTI